jgi:hypothetical protein
MTIRGTRRLYHRRSHFAGRASTLHTTRLVLQPLSFTRLRPLGNHFTLPLSISGANDFSS